MTPLMLAVKTNNNDHLDMVRYLMEDAGADINWQAVKVLLIFVCVGLSAHS